MTRLMISAVLGMLLSVSAAWAQPAATVRVTAATVVMERPRGDSFRVATVQAGETLEVSGQQDGWYLVSPVATGSVKPAWERGWIHGRYTELVSGTIRQPVDQQADAPRRAPRPLRIRGFGQTGGTLFTADDSFDTVLGSPFGPVFGGGAQVAFPNSAFVQASYEQFEESGTRALASGTQIFTLDTPASVKVQSLTATLGFHAPNYGRFVPYLGAGLGWHVLTEDGPDGEDESHGKLGYHVVGGTEFEVSRWLSFAGEVQWAAVPKGLGESGVSAFFEEDDLGGTTFRFKVIIGR